MSYTRSSALAGARDKIEIVALSIDLTAGELEVFLRKVTVDAAGNVEVPPVYKETIGGPAFAALAAAKPAGDTLYDAIKSAVYGSLIDAGRLPPAAEGWKIE